MKFKYGDLVKVQDEFFHYSEAVIIDKVPLDPESYYVRFQNDNIHGLNGLEKVYESKYLIKLNMHTF